MSPFVLYSQSRKDRPLGLLLDSGSRTLDVSMARSSCGSLRRPPLPVLSDLDELRVANARKTVVCGAATGAELPDALRKSDGSVQVDAVP